MSNLSNESTPRERLARLLTIVKRTRLYWRSATLIAGVGVLIAFVLALNTKRAWRSETTLLYRDAIQTDREQSQAARASRIAPKLKDMLYARPKLQQVIEEFGLYPEQRNKSMLHAIEEFSKNVSFKARDGQSFVISFLHEDPKIAQEVTAKLASMTIEDYNRENMSSAVLTRDFLKRELEGADKKVVSASRALATFLAENPQFQWGGTDSPYAPVPQVLGMPGAPGAPGAQQSIVAVPVPVAPRPGVPYDPKLAGLERRLAQIEAELSPPPTPVAALPPHVAEAQRARDAAAADASKAERELADLLRRLTPVHPDVAAAKARVSAAKSALAGAEAALRSAKASVPSADAPPLSAERRAALEKDRASIRRQIADLRAGRGAAKSAAKSAAKPADGEGKKDEKGEEELLAAVPDTVELETTWHRLKLDLERARETFKSLEVKAQAANIAAEAAERQKESEMVVLDPAYLPTRAERGRGKTFFAGATIAIFLALAVAGARVLLNDTLYDAGDVAAVQGPVHLVSVPHVPALESPAEPKAPRRVAKSAGGRRSRPGGDRASAPALVALREAGEGRAPASRPNGPASRPRRNASTLRYGSVLPVTPAAHATAMLGTPLAAPVVEGALARVEPAPESARSLSLYALSEWMETSFEEPEVEVVGTDLDLEDEGGQSLLRRSPTEVLAALRVLRHRLEQRRGDGHLVVGVTSPREGDGKTTLALRLAMTLAESERARVVLVEGNLDRPRLASALGIEIPEELSLSAQVRRRKGGLGGPWGVVALGPSLFVLAESGPEGAAQGTLHSSLFEEAIAALRRHYDYVVIDGPPVLGSGDANVLEEVSDGVLLVARAARTKGAELSGAAGQLGDRRIVGVVLNDVGAPERPAKDKKDKGARVASRWNADVRKTPVAAEPSGNAGRDAAPASRSSKGSKKEVEVA